MEFREAKEAEHRQLTDEYMLLCEQHEAIKIKLQAEEECLKSAKNTQQEKKVRRDGEKGRA